MKGIGIGIVTAISAVAVAAAPTAAPTKPFTTAKSTAQFADCFARAQDRDRAPWWFVPKDHGGTFSNAGAASITQPYFLLISDHLGKREIQLQDAAAEGSQAQAVNQCI